MANGSHGSTPVALRRNRVRIWISGSAISSGTAQQAHTTETAVRGAQAGMPRCSRRYCAHKWHCRSTLLKVG
jgi:hypothetical protein